MRQKQLFKWINLMMVIGWSACTTSIGKNTVVEAEFTDRYWTLTGLTAEPALDWDLDGVTETDILEKLEDCERDDAIKFTSNHMVMEHSGEEQCDEEEDVERETGTWEYNDSLKTLAVITAGHEPQIYQIAEANGDRLVLLYRVEARSATHVLTAIYAAR